MWYVVWFAVVGVRWWVCVGGCAVVGVRGACEAMWAVWVCGHVRNLRAPWCVRVSGHSLFYSTPPRFGGGMDETAGQKRSRNHESLEKE